MLVEKIIAVAAKDAGERQLPKVSASNVGKCVRALWYIHHETSPEPLPPRTMLVFSLGNLVEESVCDWIEKASKDFIRTDCRNDTTTEKETGLRARADFVCALDETPLFPDELELRSCVPGDPLPPRPGEMVGGEIKSLSNFAFERALRGDIDFTYRAQVETCLRAYDLRWWLLVAYRKETSHITEILIGRSDAVWAKILQSVQQAKAPTVPDRPYELETRCISAKDGKCIDGKTPSRGQPHKACGGTGLEIGGPFIPTWPCNYCSYKAPCWGELELAFKDGKPRWRVK